jgi:uncharacterized membrane protein YhhN
MKPLIYGLFGFRSGGVMFNPILLLVALVLLLGLLYGEKTGRRSIILGLKTPLSVLFVITAVLQPHPLPWYYHYVLVGLILGLVGDVCLALPGNKAFRAGLVAFLAGHILYVIAFARLGGSEHWFGTGVLVTIAVSIAVFERLRPHLGDMLVPVIAYIVVITIMVLAALAVYRNPAVKSMGAQVVLVGAVIFYLSDLFVARDRFVKSEFLNRLIGLPLYYCGQFLLAFSVGLVG